ncbi:hypothetical protein C8J57DRAFT_1637741 [Mycena rebaudengoi]|nr:hypothetical protein C8J57DRAFT_1637740 [Mycena rebaudengoi]KAJ7260142.1 hypothetical protein C8J57DRAFT_1637741 [Mycena rebaudengoi]
MKFAAALFALVPFVAALPPAVRTVQPEPEIRNATALIGPTPNTQGNVFVCIDSGFTNICATFHGSSGQCVNFPSNFNDIISSFGPDSGQDCFIFIDGGCSGPQNGPIRNPGISNLATIGFNDAISSFKCFFG